MFQHPARSPLSVIIGLVLLFPLGACDKFGLATSSFATDKVAMDSVTTDTVVANSAEPLTLTVFDTTLDFEAYGSATAIANGDTVQLSLPGGGEGGILLRLKPNVTAATIATFSVDATTPLNLRLTDANGELQYLSTESRAHVVLGPAAATEMLIYSANAGSLSFSVASAETCGGALICEQDGTVTVRVGDKSAATTLLATAYGAAGLSASEAGEVAVVRGGPKGEYGFNLTRETEGAEPLLIEFKVAASEPINVLVQNGEKKDYISSRQGWIRLDPGATALAYTPGTGTFKFHSFKVSACTTDEPRCLS